jgi:hypothetical protein
MTVYIYRNILPSGVCYYSSVLRIPIVLYYVAYFPYFEKVKWAYGIKLLCVCLCIPSIVTRQLLGKKIPLLLLGNCSVKIPLLLLGNCSVKKNPYCC